MLLLILPDLHFCIENVKIRKLLFVKTIESIWFYKWIKEFWNMEFRFWLCYFNRFSMSMTKRYVVHIVHFVCDKKQHIQWYMTKVWFSAVVEFVVFRFIFFFLFFLYAPSFYMLHHLRYHNISTSCRKSTFFSQYFSWKKT